MTDDAEYVIERMRDDLVRLEADKAAISETASHYLHENERLRGAIARMAVSANHACEKLRLVVTDAAFSIDA